MKEQERDLKSELSSNSYEVSIKTRELETIREQMKKLQEYKSRSEGQL